MILCNFCVFILDNERVSEYELKLMDIDQEHLSIPETDYDATIVMSSAEFQRICRDLMVISESGIKIIYINRRLLDIYLY